MFVPICIGAEFVFNYVIAANTSNFNLRAAAVAAGWNQIAPLKATVTVNAGVYVGSPSTGAYAFDTGATFPAGSSLALINNGTICGGGGAGGYGGTPGSPNGGNGGGGGTAFRAQAAISITNNGLIAGGGGGGGGGGYQTSSGYPDYLGGANGIAGGPGAGTPSGGTFTTTGGNLGGASGGGWAAYGGNGASPPDIGGGPSGIGGTGGPGGSCTSGNANITWVTTGSRYGAVS